MNGAPFFILAAIHSSFHPCFFILENNGNYALNNQLLHFTFNLWRAGRPGSACNHGSISTAFPPWGRRAEDGVGRRGERAT